MSTSETVMMMPAHAKALRESANFELQRPINKHNVARLRLEMEAGRFIPGTPIYFAVMPDKQLLALNGNHTLTAVSESQGAIELTLIYQTVNNIKEAAEIYSRFDLHRMRTWNDTLRAFRVEEMLSGSGVWTKAFAAAMGVIVESFSGQVNRQGPRDHVDDRYILATRSREMRVRLMRGATSAAEIYMNATHGFRTSSLFRRAGVMAAGVEIMRYQPSSGTEFFRTMAADDGLRLGQPQRAVLRYLQENSGAGQSPRILQARAIMRGWNAFFREQQLEMIRVVHTQEFRLQGTPWNGDFDPIESYLPEVGRQLSAPKPEVRKGKGASKIQTGVSSRGEPVAIFA